MSGVVGLLASGAVSNLVSPIINRLLDLIPNPEKRAEEAAAAAAALIAADQAMLTQQNAINLEEAKSESLFVSGWRPFIGWSCGGALLWQVLLAPFVSFNLAIFGYHPVLPALDATWITVILIPMLGIGTMRTVEKVQGVAGPLMGQPKPPASAPPPPPPAPPTGDVATVNVVQMPVRPPAPATDIRPTAPEATRPVTTVVSQHDATAIDVMARTIWGEARGEGRAGMEAVASVICRRAKFPRWWGHDIRSVCLAPSQFSCWLPSDPNRAKLEAVDSSDEDFVVAMDVAEKAVADLLSDPTHDADSYANLSVSHPRWADAAKQTAIIGHHTFFRLET
jgi:hypothetical protein